MASRNGETVFDILNSYWSRKVRDLNGEGDKGASIPGEITDQLGLEVGDEIAFKLPETKENVIEIHVNNGDR